MFGGGRVKFIALKVSAPFHCSMMKPAEEVMAKVLGDMEFSNAKYTIVQNVNAEPVINGEDLRANLVKQVSAPVRWIECVQKIRSLGCERAIEVGCGKVISGLVKKIDSDGIRTFNINSLDELKSAGQELK
jgi:[acyl-carrier-protein] S-malonyltransferase